MKYINKRCLAIAGAAMLFLGLSGSMQASPFLMSHHLDQGISLFNSHSNFDNSGSYRSLVERDSCENYYHSTDATHLDGRLANNAGQNQILPVPAVEQEYAVMCTLPKPVTEPNGTSNVPDGGATAMMVGAAMIGVVFMRKKQAA